MLGSMASANMFSYFGITSSTVGTDIFLNYLSTMGASVLALVAAHAVLGAVQGLVVGRSLVLSMPTLRDQPRKWRFFSILALGLLVVHGLFFLDNLARFPQLYVEALDAHGGLRAWFQAVVALHMPLVLPRLLLVALGAAAIALEIRALLRSPRRRRVGATLYTLGLLLGVGTGVHLGFIQPASRARSFAWKGTVTPGNAQSQVPVAGVISKKPNILLIAADSLRPDRILDGSNGTRPVAPNLSRLANQGVRFDRAYTVFPRTFPAWLSLLTGCYSHHHGVRHMFPTAEERAAIPPTLASLLKQRGYHTAVVSDFAGDIFPRVELGFDQVAAPYFHFPTIIRQRILQADVSLLPYTTNQWGSALFVDLGSLAEFANAELLTDRALRIIENLPEPWFVVIFYSTPHFPYSAPAPYFHRFTDPAYDGPFKYHKLHELAVRARTAADAKQVKDIFDGTIRAVDDQVGRLLNGLSSDRGLDQTIVVVSADHGENLLDGKLGMGHGDHLRGEYSLRIPLILWGPKWLPTHRRVPSIVRSIDLMPTLLDLMHIAYHPEAFDGQSLTGFWQDHGADANLGDREAFMETGIWFMDQGEDAYQKQRIMYPSITDLVRIDTGTNHELVIRDEFSGVVETAKHRGLYLDGYKLIYIPTPAGVQYELYDPVTDPDNEHNLAAEQPEVVARLKARLFQILEDGDPTRIRSEYVLNESHGLPVAPPPRPGWLSRLGNVLSP